MAENSSDTPFIIASLRTSWTDAEMKSWRRTAKKKLVPLALTEEQKRKGKDLYSLAIKKRVGWKTLEDGSFARTKSGRKIPVTEIVTRNRRWDYDIIIYVDSGRPSSDGHGDGARPTYAQLFEMFLSPDGWITINPSSKKGVHVPPLAPGLGYHVVEVLRQYMLSEVVSEIEAIANGTSFFKSVYSALAHVGKEIVDHVRLIMEGGIAPEFARPLSSNTLHKWRPWRGVSGDKPMIETGEILKHIHWKIVGWEKSEKIHGGGRGDPYNPSAHAHSFGREWDESYYKRLILRSDGTLSDDVKTRRAWLSVQKDLVRGLLRKVLVSKDAVAKSKLDEMKAKGLVGEHYNYIEPKVVDWTNQ